MATIHLQGIGSYPAIPARDVQVGAIRVYNYGARYRVLSRHEASGMIVFQVETIASMHQVGAYARQVFTERKRPGTLVAVEGGHERRRSLSLLGRTADRYARRAGRP